MLPDIESLALFVRIAELRSITRAASASHMSLPAASRRISMLESRFGTRLLERTPKGVDLTAMGQSVLVHAKAILRNVNDMQLELDRQQTDHVGLLATTSAMTYYLPADIARLTKTFPVIRLNIGESWSEDISRQVAAGCADIGIIVEGTLGAKGLELIPYRSYHIAALIPGSHPLAGAKQVFFNDILDEELIALENTSLMMKSLSEKAILLEKTFSPKVQVRSFEAVCRFVQAGLGVGLLPYEAAVLLASELNLHIRILDEPWAERKMHLCCRKEKINGARIQQVVSVLSQVAKSKID